MLVRWLERIALSLAGSALGAFVVALVESRAAVTARASYGEILFVDLGVLAPLALAIGLAIGLAAIVLDPEQATTIGEHLRAVREEPVLARSRTAAIAPLAIVALLFWCTIMAHAARVELGRGTPADAGARLAGLGIAFAIVLLAMALAALGPLRRALAAGADRNPSLVDPTRTGAIALLACGAIVAIGIRGGDTGGDGFFPLGIFGVLKRSELDLRPLVNLAAIAVPAWLIPMAGRIVRRAWTLAIAIPIVLFLTQRAAHARGEIATAIESHAPLGKIALGLVRKMTDRDHDGSSPLFGGGDCDDRNARVHPGAIDVPGNGIDEDCSGMDTPAPLPPPIPPTPKTKIEVPDDLDIIFITIDTVRADGVGFLGYSKPTTPNLDKLAEKSVVFERAYALASYTGKSIGPMLVGKYPSETQRDGGHFTKYDPSNLFVTERLHREGVRTFGGASHWYFHDWSGLSQGMDLWDMNAKPRDGQGDNDTSITSAELTNEAIALLKNPENTQKRFFAWFHYFDPHVQYMQHEGAPDFLAGSTGGAAAVRALYDGEVWFADREIGRLLDFIETQPWAQKTAIIVTSDHGEAFGEHDMSWHGVDLWECLVRVPLVIYVPGTKPHHVKEKRSHIDLVPTMLGLMKTSADDLSGQSMLEDLYGEGPDRDILLDMPVGPYTLYRRALIHDHMKIVHLGGTQWQLFDLESDPDEKNDLSADTEKLAPMQTLFEQKRATLKEIEVPPLPP